MKILLSSLKKYLNINLSPEEISTQLTLLGLEVDSVEPTTFNFEGVVTGFIEEAIPHPDADRLRIATVSDGKESFQVVCGAPNCRAGIVTAFAKIGAFLTDEEGKRWDIKKAKLRGVESYGMLCAESELGLSQEHDGIIEFPADTPAGINIKDLYTDFLFEISLTPNLGHCMSSLGVARELAARLNKKISIPSYDFTEANEATSDVVQVDICAPNECPYYSYRIVKNVKTGPSPKWLKKALESVGARSINNLVDVATYIMLELGQPLHLFDLDKIHDKKLIVDVLPQETLITTLDEKERKVPKDALVIRDAKQPLAIAGIMGDLSSAISDNTQNILIESAVFSPQSIRKTSRLMALKTDASSRFDKGVDYEMASNAVDFAAALIQQVTGGEILKGKVEKKSLDFAKRKISCRIPRINSVLGTTLSKNEILEIFSQLEISILKDEEESLLVEVPSYRNDLSTEIDLVEEVARIYGFNNIPESRADHIASPISDAPIYLFENEIRSALIGQGLQECITCDLISPFLAELTEERETHSSLIHVLQPSSSDQSILRRSLLPGLLQVVKLNNDQKVSDIAAFEVGRVHFKEEGQYKEQTLTGIILSGSSRPHHFDPKPQAVDFFDLKGVVENLLLPLGIDDIYFEPCHLHNFHPYRQARIKKNDIILGIIGEIHPSHLKKMDIPKKVYFAELNLHELFVVKNTEKKYQELPLYPGSERDWTLTVTDLTPIETIISSIKEEKSPLLEEVYLLDLFKSDKLGADKKNVTLRFHYRDKLKTVSQEDVDSEHTKITQSVAKKLVNCLV